MSSSPSQNSSEPDGLLRILVAAFSGVLFGWFWSKLKTPVQESTETVYPSTNTDDSRTEAKPPLPLAVTIESYPPPSISEGEKTEKRENRWLNRGNFVATALTAIFAAGLLCVTYRYAKYTYNMWGEMQQQTCIQRETAVNSERAWVGLGVPVTLDAVALDQKTGKVFIKGHYSIQNFGKGPAIKVMQFGNFLNTDKGLNPEKRLQMQKVEADGHCDAAVKFTTGTLPVDGSMKQPPPFGYTLFPNQTHNEAIEYQGQIETAEFLQYVGCVAYLDQFKTVHWTRFAMWRGPHAANDVIPNRIPHLDFYSLYNDTDEQKEKPCQETHK